MKIKNSVSFLLLLLFGLQYLSAQKVAVMSFNIRLDMASDGENRWDMRKAELVNLLLTENLDFIGLQEAKYHQRMYVDSCLPDYKQIGAGRDDGKMKGEAVPIFYRKDRFKLLKKGSFWLSETPEIPSLGWDAAYPRICTYGRFEDRITKRAVWVLNTHFDHVGVEARLKSVEQILFMIKRIPSEDDIILMGDFNCLPNSKPYQLWHHNLWDARMMADQIKGARGTFNGFQINAQLYERIDYVFTNCMYIQSLEHLENKRHNGLWISDHLPVKGVINFSRKGCQAKEDTDDSYRISRKEYGDKLQGFWLGECIANWTGLVTEMDKIGSIGAIKTGEFYTRNNWGKPDQPSIWGEGIPSALSKTIDFVFRDTSDVWGADDDTDIEYMYQHLLHQYKTCILSPQQIRDGWLKHIKKEEENYLWVSNQRAFELMNNGVLPPLTSLPDSNAHYEMIDAQLTTEIFGLFAPCNPKVALRMAYLPIRTTARENAAWISDFYVYMHALASAVDPEQSIKEQILWMANEATIVLPADSYSRKMYNYVKLKYDSGIPWEQARDSVYQRYQVDQKDGYNMTSKHLYCNGCFAAGINFAASLISLFYGEGDLQETIKIAVLAGWDSDNPAATWGGLLGFIYGKRAIEEIFNRKFSDQFNIHRTRENFPNNGIDDFENMAKTGIFVIDRVVSEEIGGRVDLERNEWLIPHNHL